jgi:hypothetical protein
MIPPIGPEVKPLGGSSGREYQQHLMTSDVAATSRQSMFGRANASYFIHELEIIAQHADGSFNDLFSVFLVSSK